MQERREVRGRFGRDCLGVAMLLVAGAAIAGCSQEKIYEADTSPVVPPPINNNCVVTDEDIRQWIENPSMPLGPKGSAYDCFFNFAWQELFAVTQPEGTAGVPRFATWPNDQELFPAHGDPGPWRTGDRLIRGRQIHKGLGLPGAHGVIADQFKEAAALTPLTDQKGRFVHYSVLVNRLEYDYVRCCELYRGGCFNTMGGVQPPPVVPPPAPLVVPPPVQSQINLPDGSVELKLAWRVLETCDLPDSKRPCTKEDTSRYLTVRGEVEFFSKYDPSQPVKTFPALLGLVGIHIVHWTKQYPGAVWATFEHVDNAPDCVSGPDGPIQEPPPGFSGWSFYNAQCDTATPYCQENQYCPPCPVIVAPEVAAAFNTNTNNTWDIPVDPQTGIGRITCTPAPNEFNQPVKLTVTKKDGSKVEESVWIPLFNPKCPNPPIPTQTCRTTPISTDVERLNNRVRNVLTGLIPPEGRGVPAVLSYYELVGAEWFPNADDDQKNQPQGSPAVNNQVMLSNTTLETYQDIQTLPSGCVLCHSNMTPSGGSVNAVPSVPPMQYNSGLADRSFVFQQIRQFGVPCGKDQPAQCDAWKEGCPAKM
jgi:hypothetical protein